jgi:import inner membrane translocase subunit TIM9
MNAIAESLQQGSDAEKQAMLMKLEEMQLKDTLRMFNGLVERCFCECVVSFRSKALTATEEKCVSTCAEKYMKHSGRVGQRFGEFTMAEQQAQAAAAARAGQ